MNENDLSDAAYEKWSKDNGFALAYGICAWQEAVGRATANPWQLFPIERLEIMLEELGGSYMPYEIQAELDRRKGR